jgi:cytochrome c oxidase subunit 2
MAPPPPAQSMFAIASDGAEVISHLGLLLIWGSAGLFLLVMFLLVRVVQAGPRPVKPSRWLIGGGLVLPFTVLSLLLVHSLRISDALSHDPEMKGLEVQVVARRWWWEFRYRNPEGGQSIVLANELHLPLDCAAVLTFSSDDVIHSFWVPALGGKVDVIPGAPTRLVVHATQTGRLRGQCAEYCGTQHANMGLEVVVETPDQFRLWLLNQAKPAAVPDDPLKLHGQRTFLDSGCGSCHTIRGTGAAGVLGPDLTHVASRRGLAAATLANETGALIAWIHEAQHIKPGSLMPSMPVMSSESTRALAAYLGSLH